MTKTVRLAGQTDVGQHRRDNQDTFICQPIWTEHTALLVVIDGVGGYAGGEQAAAIAKSSIERYMATPTGDTLTMLREAVIYANNQIADQRQQETDLSRMCCVLTAAVADTQTRSLAYVHVGDTRLYRFRQQTLEKLTHDHSIVGMREDADQLTEAEAMRHPRRNEILREVGSAPRRVDDPDFLESDETDFLPGDLLLLCSDGLTDMLTRAQLTVVLTEPLSEEDQVAELIRQANQQGGHDNITVVLARNNTAPEAVIPDVPPVVSNETMSQVTPLTAGAASGETPTDPIETGRRRRLRYVGLLALVGVLIGLAYQSAQQPDASVAPAPVDSLNRPLPASVDSLSARPMSPTAVTNSRDTNRSVNINHRNLPDSPRKP